MWKKYVLKSVFDEYFFNKILIEGILDFSDKTVDFLTFSIETIFYDKIQDFYDETVDLTNKICENFYRQINYQSLMSKQN